jgi:voltage-gated potassium channel
VPSLNAMRAVYFSFVTITTVGYGEIQPKASDWLSQALILAELIVGIFFVAVLIGRITSHVVIQKPSEWATGK